MLYGSYYATSSPSAKLSSLPVVLIDTLPFETKASPMTVTETSMNRWERVAVALVDLSKMLL